MRTKSPLKRKLRPSAAKGGRMTARLVKIGNSRGIRLPKSVIEQAGLGDAVEISVRDDAVIIRSTGQPHPRAGWEAQIKKVLAEHGEELSKEDREWLDAPLDPQRDGKEWTW